MKKLSDLIHAVEPLSRPGSRVGRFSVDVLELLCYCRRLLALRATDGDELITDRIDNAILDARRLGVPEPKRIYLGQKEWRALSRLMQTLLVTSCPTTGHTEYRGLRVHALVEPEHLEVA